MTLINTQYSTRNFPNAITCTHDHDKVKKFIFTF